MRAPTGLTRASRCLTALLLGVVTYLTLPIETAAASCDTAVNCAIEAVEGLPGQAEATVESTVTFLEQQAEQGDFVCVYQGRRRAGDGLTGGPATCFGYDGYVAPPGSVMPSDGSILLYSTSIGSFPGGTPYLTASTGAAELYGDILDLSDLVTTPGPGGTGTYTGAWSARSSPGSGDVRGVLHVFPASALDPQGAGDYFVDGALVFSHNAALPS
jgi:hypothetical protein